MRKPPAAGDRNGPVKRTARGKGSVAGNPAQPRASRALQRQRLIDACISALHVHGPSHTTVEKVVAIAGMSPGIVRFYFDSKAAMLVASLEFLSAEFEERLLVPVAALAGQPVAALEQLVDLYLGAELASTRKVSVWYSFWGEASSRQEYYDICGARDEKFEALVRELIGQVIEATGSWHLDADAIALGLIGVLEMIWQSFAFQTESTIDRPAARRRAMAYLRSVFPTAFRTAATDTDLPPGAYASAVWFEAEQRGLFRDAWQFVGHGAELAQPGDFKAVDTAADSLILVRQDDGGLAAFRNACPQRPHALVAPGSSGHRRRFGCELHGFTYAPDGRPADGTQGPPLVRLALALEHGLIFVRRALAAGDPPPPAVAAALPMAVDGGLSTSVDLEVAADWKVLVEQWLEELPEGAYVAPNQIVMANAGGVDVLQAIPLAPGRCRLRHWSFLIDETASHRLQARLLDVSLAASVQRGLQSPAFIAGTGTPPRSAIIEFRRAIARLVPTAARGPTGTP